MSLKSYSKPIMIDKKNIIIDQNGNNFKKPDTKNLDKDTAT